MYLARARHRERSTMTRKREEKLSHERIVETFVKACGLRKCELERLRVCDIYQANRDFQYENYWIHVDAFEGTPDHEVPFMSSCEWIIAVICKGHSSDDLLFIDLPDLDYEGLREEYADDLFWGYYETLGLTGAPHSIQQLGQHLKQALGMRYYDEKRRRMMRWAHRDMRREAGIL
jgi:hypothetical protein